MKRSLLVLLSVLILTGSALADSVTIKALGPMQATNTSPGVFLFSVNGTGTVGFPDMTPGMPVKGQSWTATVLPFTSFAQASFGTDSDAMQDYEAAAWLILQEPQNTHGGSMDIQMAVLALFNPGIENSKTWNVGAAAWLAKAESNSYQLSQFAGFEILVPSSCITPKCTPIELLVPPSGGVAPAPEPASMALFGIGLLALGGTLRKRLLAQR
jgi:hypothetical protein